MIKLTLTLPRMHTIPYLGRWKWMASRLSRFFVFFVLLHLTASPSWTAEATLARLSFRVPPERIAEFETSYQNNIVPVLNSTLVIFNF